MALVVNEKYQTDKGPHWKEPIFLQEHLRLHNMVTKYATAM